MNFMLTAHEWYQVASWPEAMVISTLIVVIGVAAIVWLHDLK